MRHNPSTVVVLAGQPSEEVLAALGQSLNVVLIRPDLSAGSPGRGRGGATSDGGSAGGIEIAAAALRRAGGVSAAYVLVAADPLAGVAAAWEAMWSLTAQSRGSDEFELRAAEALGAWRAGQFELPDYYLVLVGDSSPARDRAAAEAVGAPVTAGASRARASGAGASRAGITRAGSTAGADAPAGAGEPRADFYLGPLRSLRPHRVAVAAGASPTAQAEGLLSELASLRHGRWWPPLDEIVREARGFYPGSLAGSPATLLG